MPIFSITSIKHNFLSNILPTDYLNLITLSTFHKILEAKFIFEY